MVFYTDTHVTKQPKVKNVKNNFQIDLFTKNSALLNKVFYLSIFVLYLLYTVYTPLFIP